MTAVDVASLHAGESGFLFHQSQYHQSSHDEPKPNHSYIGIIAMAILGSKERKLVLSDIYQWILDNYPYFRRRGPGWRNSIRHNLSLNDCFIKAGRSANGKGHYWAIHPANVDDFERGDFRRRRAQRKVRRAMGLSVADDDDDSPVPSPSTPAVWAAQFARPKDDAGTTTEPLELRVVTEHEAAASPLRPAVTQHARPMRKRLFDVESLLAPDIVAAVDKPEVKAPRPEIEPMHRRNHDAKEEDDDVIVDSHCQPISTAVCDDYVTTTSGATEKIVDEEIDVVTSLNPFPVRKSGADADETGLSCRWSSDTVSGLRSYPEMARLWLRHANMASSRLASAFFPFPATAAHYATNCVNADGAQLRDINRSDDQGYDQGQTQSQGRCSENQMMTVCNELTQNASSPVKEHTEDIASVNMNLRAESA